MHVAQRAMEQAMLGIRLVDRVSNIETPRWTKVFDVSICVMELEKANGAPDKTGK